MPFLDKEAAYIEAYYIQDHLIEASKGVPFTLDDLARWDGG